ncbi:MAG: DUF11 domain-containing protein [Bacteroidetes bacterium]|nr:MAG: DUF11 domain-containing protein [Bacteroidota bacterium]
MNRIVSSIAVVMLLGLLAAETAYAVGTPAGTVIQTRSRMVYTTAGGGQSDTVYSNYVSFTVAQVASVNMTPASNASTANADSVYVAYPVTVTNSGNGSDYFTFSAVSSKGWSVTYYFDANGNGILDAGELSGGAVTQTPNLAADAEYKLMVRIFVPRSGALNGQKDTTTVTAKSHFDTTKSNTAAMVTTVNTVNFPTIGTALTVTPSNPSPGQNVVYSMTLTNTGAVAATGVTFTDLINTGLFSFVSATTTQGTFDGVAVPATWTVGTINPGGSVTVSITLQVKPAVALGTTLTNVINVHYTVGGNTFTVTTNNPYAAVGVVRGVQISPLNLSASKEPDDTLVYALTVKNTGNSKDVLELSFSSDKGFPWTLYRDVNGNGVYDGGDVALTDSPGSNTGVDVDSVASTDSVKILARVVVPNTETDQEQDLTTVTVKSAADNAKFQSSNLTTTVNIAALTLSRTVSPSGDQPPGQEMNFEVSFQNNGHGKAYNVVVTETEGDSMSYVANSVTINTVAKTDAADSDEVTVTTAGGRKVITVNLGTVNALSSVGIIRYRASIH